MADNDEPTDDLRAVAMQAAAAAARVVETIARDQQRRAGDTSRTPLREPYRSAPQQQMVTAPPVQGTGTDAPSAGRHVTPKSADLDQLIADQLEVDGAQMWAKAIEPDRFREYQEQLRGSGTPEDTRRVRDQLVSEWQEWQATAGPNSEAATSGQKATQTATVAISQTQVDGLPYDSRERRAAANDAMRAAGVPDEARDARNVADLMNGADPALAASSGRPIKAAVKAPAKAPGRDRTR